MQTLICTTKSACGYIIDTKSNEELAEKLGLLRSKRDMALLIAEKILEGETFFSIREVAKENVTEINGSCVVLTLEEYEKNMRDQFKRGLDSGNGMMPARSLK